MAANGGSSTSTVATRHLVLVAFTSLSVASGTVRKLVEELVAKGTSDLRYLRAFLLTHRSFTSSANVLSLLREKYESADNVEENVLDVLEIWIVDQFDDFTSGPHALERDVLAWAADVEALGDITRAQRIRAPLAFARKPTVDHSRHKSMRRIPPSKLPIGEWSRLALMDLDPEEVARQLTLIESNVMRAIDPSELLDKAWTREDADIKAPHILLCIKHFNRTIFQLSTAIVSPYAVEVRAQIIRRLIDICEQLRLQMNFNTLKAVLAALSSGPVVRLKETWSYVGPASLQVLEDIQNDLSGEKGHSRYRKVLYASTPPALPFLGLLLTDLSFIEDGHPSIQESPDPKDDTKTVINFVKFQFLFNIIEDWRYYVSEPYSFRPVPQIQHILTSMPELDEDTLYSLSTQREPPQS